MSPGRSVSVSAAPGSSERAKPGGPSPAARPPATLPASEAQPSPAPRGPAMAEGGGEGEDDVQFLRTGLVCCLCPWKRHLATGAHRGWLPLLSHEPVRSLQSCSGPLPELMRNQRFLDTGTPSPVCLARTSLCTIGIGYGSGAPLVWTQHSGVPWFFSCMTPNFYPPQEDEVVLQCSATILKEQLKLCLAAEGFGNRLCFLEPTSNAQKVPPDLAICCLSLEQSLSVRALQEMLANTVEVGSEGVDLDKWVGADFTAVIPPTPVPHLNPFSPVSLPCFVGDSGKDAHEVWAMSNPPWPCPAAGQVLQWLYGDERGSAVLSPQRKASLHRR
ncbi:hypothetical protein lerEdw1_009768 [Lerista edwardsae]|nr:hypothetical protein lerEdw1_009768 [Lerista edwardsae]